MQECPKCENNFKLLSIRSSATLGEVETQGHATYCPYCGVNLNSWDAWLDKEVLIFYDNEQTDGFPVILKEVDEDYNLFHIYDPEDNQTYEIESKYVYTPN